MFAFFVGAAIVVGGLIDECPRVGAIAVGLLMMGVFSVPEAMRFIQGRSNGSEGPK